MPPVSLTVVDAPPSRSPLATAARRFVRNRAAFVALLLLAVIMLACFVGPLLSPNNAIDSDWSAISLAPTLDNMHWFGTDELGRDLLVRTLVGGRVSLEVGLLGTLVSGLIGVAWGATAGYLGGRVDAVMMRIVDMMYAIPYMLIAILMMTLFGRAFYLVVLTISAFSWLDMARVVRGQTLSLRSREFIDAAKAIGVDSRSIITRHIVPNLIGVVVVYATVTVPGIVLTESVLSFLGLGVQEPMTSWGVLIQDGA
ncbi:MAG: ABC transporter permease, partial [Paraburkholderia hospita]